MKTDKPGYSLVLFKEGVLSTVNLDSGELWTVGRTSEEGVPDIELNVKTIGRRHGKFRNTDGVWAYIDGYSINGTMHNKKQLAPGRNGRPKPVIVENGDTFIFGSNGTGIINNKTVFGAFFYCSFDREWEEINTSGAGKLKFISGGDTMIYNNPDKGTIVDMKGGIAICLGDKTFIIGDMVVITGNE